MLLTRAAVSALSVVLLVSITEAVSGQQNYPNRPVRIVTAEAGGGNDFTARLLAQGLGGSLGQPVIVENRAGAGGAIAAELVARAQPDGHTLILYGSNFFTLPLLKKVPYDVVKDFAPVTAVGSTPNVLVVHPSLAANSVKELIALAKSKPGELNASSGGTGGSNHLAAELFKAMAGLNILLIHYSGAGPALNALIGGQVHMMFATASASAPHIKSGKLRALAVTTAQPSVLAPGLPTVAASGLAGYEAVSVYGVFAPAKTPPAIVTRLNQDAVRFLSRADVKEKFLNVGIDVIGSSTQELAAAVKSEMTRLGKVIKDANIRAAD